MGIRKFFDYKTITHQIGASIVALLVGTIMLTWFMTSTLLDQYYIRIKTDGLYNCYQELDEACSSGRLYSDDYWPEFEKLCAENNVTVLIASSSGKPVLSSMNSYDIMLQLLNDALFNTKQDDEDVLESSENYTILKKHDDRINGDFLVFWGTLSDGNIIMIRASIESMMLAAQISTQFLIYVGVGILILTVLFAELITRRITRPIINLTELSRKMAALDFNAKYEPTRFTNEIDTLGEHMNSLSETLEDTIGQLKSANVSLQKDIEKKDKTEQMRKEFLSNVSHELKTPIALIQGYAEGLKDGIIEDQESRDYYLDVIIDESVKMNRMVKELLALNQLEFGDSQLSMERFNLTEVVKSVIHANTIMCEKNEISVEFDEGDVNVWSDPFFTEQVVTNYFSNAIHYCKNEKNIKVYYTINNNIVRVSVFNTGDCIPSESLPHLWEKFYKVDKARTREYGGSGIGLSVVKAVMDDLGRECGVINHEDGVEFYFELECSK